jgi:hypothetical protein
MSVPVPVAGKSNRAVEMTYFIEKDWLGTLMPLLHMYAGPTHMNIEELQSTCVPAIALLLVKV